MECPSCAIVPNTHSFIKFGKIGETTYFYSSPARAKNYEKDAVRLANFKMHLNSANSGKWIWILDLTGTGSSDFTSVNFNMGLASTIVRDYSVSLQEIWLINLNTWATPIVSMMKKLFNHKLFNTMQIINSSGLELYMDIKKLGLSGPPLIWLNKTLTTKTDMPLQEPHPIS